MQTSRRTGNEPSLVSSPNGNLGPVVQPSPVTSVHLLTTRNRQAEQSSGHTWHDCPPSSSACRRRNEVA